MKYNDYSVAVAVCFGGTRQDVTKIKNIEHKAGATDVIEWIQRNEDYIACGEGLVVRVANDYANDEYLNASLWLDDEDCDEPYKLHHRFDIIRKWFDSKYNLGKEATEIDWDDNGYLISYANKVK